MHSPRGPCTYSGTVQNCMEGNNDMADLIKVILYVEMGYFYPRKSSSCVTIITKTGTLSELEFIVDDTLECMGNTAWVGLGTNKESKLHNY